MKNRYGVEYWFVPVADNLYRFDMKDRDDVLMRVGGKEGQEGINRNDLGFFDPSGGPYVAIGSKIYWDEIHEGTKQEPLTVTRIMDRGDEGLFVEVA